MKLRIFSAALLLASFVAAGFSASVLAQSSCTPADSDLGEHEQAACVDGVILEAVPPMGGFVNVVNVNDTTTLPLPPRSNSLNDVVSGSVWDANGNAVAASQMEICFSDPSASGNVYMWAPSSSGESLYSSSLTGSWMLLPTFHLPGWDCATSWYAGTFTRN